jgi:hypothetical protein
MPVGKVVSTPQECMKKEPGSACRCEGRFPVSPQRNQSTAQYRDHLTTESQVPVFNGVPVTVVAKSNCADKLAKQRTGSGDQHEGNTEFCRILSLLHDMQSIGRYIVKEIEDEKAAFRELYCVNVHTVHCMCDKDERS